MGHCSPLPFCTWGSMQQKMCWVVALALFLCTDPIKVAWQIKLIRAFLKKIKVVVLSCAILFQTPNPTKVSCDSHLLKNRIQLNHLLQCCQQKVQQDGERIDSRASEQVQSVFAPLSNYRRSPTYPNHMTFRSECAVSRQTWILTMTSIFIEIKQLSDGIQPTDNQKVEKTEWLAQLKVCL